MRDDPLVRAVSSLIAETITGGGVLLAAQAHDLSEETVEALGVAAGDPLERSHLSRSLSAKALREEGSFRILLLPEVSTARTEDGRGYRIELQWRDLVTGESGRLVETAPAGPEAIDATGRLAVAAQQAWRIAWKGSGKKLENVVLSGRLSGSLEASAAWADARVAWNTGRAEIAVDSLLQSLEMDPGFDAARVGLAWIRLAQGRPEEAGSLAAEAVGGDRLSRIDLEMATVIRTAATGDGDALLTLAEALEGDGARSPWTSLTRGMGYILKDKYARAIGSLDEIRLHRPNDPAVLHMAGIAGLGAEDFYEAETHLARAVQLWPQNELIRGDLAEMHIRNRDVEAARQALEDWSSAFQPQDRPVRGEAWDVENPPPPVRARAVEMLTGTHSAAIENLASWSSSPEIQQAPWQVRVPILYWLHEMQLKLTNVGEKEERQRRLDAARNSLRSLEALLPDEERDSRPWIYKGLQALLYVRESRISEARKIREEILEASGLPGYDPGVEAEILANITLQEADTEGHFEACKRAIRVRGSLEDLYRLAQAYTMIGDWRGVEVQYQLMVERLHEWSASRREDGYLSSPITSGHVPFIYYAGALARTNQGDAVGTRKRFGLFLAYFRKPDPVFRRFRSNATERGVKAAW
jgi:tetratricopeptide (TPR) repeat protein